MNQDSPDRTVRFLAFLDAARVHAGDVPGTRAAEQSLAALGNAARAWASVECPTCGRRGDHVWEELTGEEYYAHYTEGQLVTASRMGSSHFGTARSLRCRAGIWRLEG